MSHIGVVVTSTPEGVVRLHHRQEDIRVEILPNEWNRWDGLDAFGELVKKKIDAARAARAEEEKAKKLAAMDEHARRRATFYEAEVEAFQKGLVPNPEEPNVRVYGRAIVSVFEVAQRGLSAQEFKALVGIVEEFTRDMVKEGGK